MTNQPQLPAYFAEQNRHPRSRPVARRQSRRRLAAVSLHHGQSPDLIDGVGEEIPIATYDPKTGPYLDCVIIDVLDRTSKIYYDKPYDPGDPVRAARLLLRQRHRAVTQCRKPQSRTCAACPQAAWGSKVSAVSGKGVKACADIQKMAMLVPGYEMPFLMRVPPNSRTNFRGYVNKFVGQPMDLCDVTTRISFEQGTIGTLAFGAVGCSSTRQWRSATSWWPPRRWMR